MLALNLELVFERRRERELADLHAVQEYVENCARRKVYVLDLDLKLTVAAPRAKLRVTGRCQAVDGRAREPRLDANLCSRRRSRTRRRARSRRRRRRDVAERAGDDSASRLIGDDDARARVDERNGLAVLGLKLDLPGLKSAERDRADHLIVNEHIENRACGQVDVLDLDFQRAPAVRSLTELRLALRRHAADGSPRKRRDYPRVLRAGLVCGGVRRGQHKRARRQHDGCQRAARVI